MPRPATPEPLFTVLYTNIPSNLLYLAFRRTSGGAASSNAASSSSLANGSVALQVKGVTASSADVMTTLSLGVPLTYGHQTVLEDVNPTNMSLSMDVGSSLLPWLRRPIYDAVTRTITVTSSTQGTGASPDIVIAQVVYQRAMGVGSWTIFAPTVADLQLPAIPMDVADPIPPNTPVLLEALEVDNFNGYQAAHLDPNAAWARAGSSRSRISTSPM